MDVLFESLKGIEPFSLVWKTKALPIYHRLIAHTVGFKPTLTSSAEVFLSFRRDVLVLSEGFEPSRLAALEFESSLSANSMHDNVTGFPPISAAKRSRTSTLFTALVPKTSVAANYTIAA